MDEWNKKYLQLPSSMILRGKKLTDGTLQPGVFFTGNRKFDFSITTTSLSQIGELRKRRK